MGVVGRRAFERCRAPNVWRAVAAALIAAGLLCGSAAAARADAGPKPQTGWYLPVGLTMGLSIHREGISNGYFLGMEASYVYLSALNLFWAGAYVDALADFGATSGRFTIGPEIGFGLFGIDGGYLLNVDNDGAHHGTSVRFLFTLAFTAFYGRWEHLFGDARERNVGEVGLLIKIPFPIDVEPLPRHREPPPAQSSGGQSSGGTSTPPPP